jgi:transposase
MGKRVNLKPHRDEIIRLRTEEGWSAYQLAEKYDVGYNTIRRRLKDWGVYESMIPDASHISDHKEEIIRLRTEEGWSTYQLGEKYGVASSTITRRLKKWDVYESFNDASHISNHKDEIIRLRTEAGWSTYQLAKKFDVGRATIERRLKKWDVYESRKWQGGPRLDLFGHKDEIIRLRTEEGWSVHQLADKFGVGEKTIIKRLKKWNVYEAYDCDYVNQKTYVYLMETPTDNLHYSKIGISNNPEKRVKAIERMGTRTLKWQFTQVFEFPTRAEAYAMEQALHKANAEHRVVREFFRVPTSELNLAPLAA